MLRESGGFVKIMQKKFYFYIYVKKKGLNNTLR